MLLAVVLLVLDWNLTLDRCSPFFDVGFQELAWGTPFSTDKGDLTHLIYRPKEIQGCFGEKTRMSARECPILH